MKSANYKSLMGRRLWALMALFLIIAQTTRGEIIPQSRRTTWQAGVVGGIPTRTTIFANLTTANTLAQINAAIANCPSNQVVQLAAGTYALTDSVLIDRKNGVVLRGAGPDKTILSFGSGNGYANVRFIGTPFNDPNANEPPNVRDWTGGYAQGMTSITLSSTSGLSVGTMLILDQLNDNTDVNGSGIETASYCGRQLGGRVQIQAVRVTAISGNTVTISPGLYMPNWKAANSPQAWWFGGTLEMSGLEDLTVSNVAGARNNVSFENARNCWMKNVNSYNAREVHLRTYIAANIEARHSYFFGTVNAASQSYGVNWYWAWDCRCEDNIFNKVTTPISLEAGAEGHVMAYNYCTNMYYTVWDQWMIECMMTHGAHSSFNLFEGNHATSLYMDFIHGSGSHNTAFRNRLSGWEPNKIASTFSIASQYMNHYANVVGNILGQSGYHDTYECANGACNTAKAIYYLGYYDTSGSTVNYDPVVPNTILRHGNYDVVTGGIKWDASISDHSLPNSYIYTSKPSWFGNRPWPPYDPANPASNSPTNIPAGYRFVFGVDPPGGSLNQPPLATANATPTSGAAPLAVAFSSTGSSDPEGASLSFSWTFGDGSPNSAAANPSHTYLADGVYIARLTVSDGTNSTSSSDLTIRVGNQPPVAVASANPTSGAAPLAVSFSSAGSSDAEGATLSYNWTFGDGTSSTSANPTHTYQTTGVYVAKLSVSDGTKTTSASDITINVVDHSSGLVAAYGFDAGTGTAVTDLSGNGNTGTISGATWTTQGKYGPALEFNGLSDLVVVNGSASLNVSSAMTLEAWVYPTATPSDWCAILHRETDAYYLHTSNPNGSLRPAGGAIFNGTESYVGAPAAVPINAWTHLATTYDGAMLRLYVNGNEVATMAKSGTIETNSKALRIGGNTYAGQFFTGRIDEIRIYNRSLGVTEIRTDMTTPVSANDIRPAPPLNARVVSP